MRTKKTTRVSFSDGEVRISLPRCWEELTQSELAAVYRVKAACSETGSESVTALAFAAISGMKVLFRRDGRFACRFRSGRRRVDIWVSPDLLAEQLDPLEFINEPGAVPVRLDRMQGRDAIDARLLGVTFGTYLRLENLYQGFLASRDAGVLAEIAALLYPGGGFDRLEGYEQVNVLNWMVQVKNMFAAEFRNFFRPAAGSSEVSMLDVMNCEIRALTGGDVTKEDMILEIECRRALTELDFLAREAEERKRDLKRS